MTNRRYESHTRVVKIVGLSLLGGMLYGTGMMTFVYVFYDTGKLHPGLATMLQWFAFSGLLGFGLPAIPIMLATLWTRKLWPGFALTIGPIAAAEIAYVLAGASGIPLASYLVPHYMLPATALLAICFAPPRTPLIDRGKCGACGYDLRGMRAGTSTTCPECGAMHDEEGRTIAPPPDVSIPRRLALWFAGATISGGLQFVSLYLTVWSR